MASLASSLRRLVPHRFRPAAIALRQVERQSAMRVMAGPFQGMRYVSEACGSSLHPKLLGTYERELFGIVESFRAAPLDVLLDIGAAEGYYAIGFLHAGLAERVVAYEAEAAGRRLLRLMAESNGVEDRLTIAEKCTAEDLQRELEGLAGRRFAMVMDVEGAEAELLDPSAVPALRGTSMLVELHECFVPGLDALITSRFAATHRVTRFEPEPRHPQENRCLAGLTRFFPEHIRAFPLLERGVHTPWLWLQPLADA